MASAVLPAASLPVDTRLTMAAGRRLGPALTTVPTHTGLNETSSVHPGLQRLQDSLPTGEGHRQPPVVWSHPEPPHRGPTTEWPWPGISVRGIQLRKDLAGPEGKQARAARRAGGPVRGLSCSSRPRDRSPDSGRGEADPAHSEAGGGGGGGSCPTRERLELGRPA